MESENTRVIVTSHGKLRELSLLAKTHVKHTQSRKSAPQACLLNHRKVNVFKQMRILMSCTMLTSVVTQLRV